MTRCIGASAGPAVPDPDKGRPGVGTLYHARHGDIFVLSGVVATHVVDLQSTRGTVSEVVPVRQGAASVVLDVSGSANAPLEVTARDAAGAELGVTDFTGRGDAPLAILVDAACFTPVDEGNLGES